MAPCCFGPPSDDFPSVCNPFVFLTFLCVFLDITCLVLSLGALLLPSLPFPRQLLPTCFASRKDRNLRLWNGRLSYHDIPGPGTSASLRC
jgi:hypothetical protein